MTQKVKRVKTEEQFYSAYNEAVKLLERLGNTFEGEELSDEETDAFNNALGKMSQAFGEKMEKLGIIIENKDEEIVDEVEDPYFVDEDVYPY